MGHYSHEPKAPLQDVQINFREAGERMGDLGKNGKLTMSDWAVWNWVQTHMHTWTRLTDKVTVRQIMEDTGLSRSSVSRALKHLTDEEVIHWMPSTVSDSFLTVCPVPRTENDATSPEYLASPRCDKTLRQRGDTTREQEVVNKKLNLEREREHPKPDEELTPDEEHEVDAGMAAFTLCEHLFPGKDMPDLRKIAYRRLLDVHRGSVLAVLDIALAGTPTRRVKTPGAYLRTWIRNAEEDFTLTHHADVLTTQAA